MSESTTSTTQKPSEGSDIGQALWGSIGNGSGLGLLACIAVLVIFAQLGNLSKKPRLASGYWGGNKEIAIARRKAMKQIAGRKRNSVALYIGVKNPKYKVPDSKRLFLPDVQRGTAVVGAPGSGKTFSVIDPMLRSAVELGYPIILYDFK